jgi:hypothetical protein
MASISENRISGEYGVICILHLLTHTKESPGGQLTYNSYGQLYAEKLIRKACNNTIASSLSINCLRLSIQLLF